ncbi:hypothetical protein [Methylobacterium sp. A54F]
MLIPKPIPLSLSTRLATASLAALLLAGTGAWAQSQPGWVDPPARSAPKAAEKAPDAPAAAKPAPAEAGPQAEADAEAAPAPQRSRRAARVREHRQEAGRMAGRFSERRSRRRLSDAPPMMQAAPPAPAADEGRMAEWGAAAQGLALDYLDAVSTPGDALAASAARYYAPEVRFHGRLMGLAALVAEKRRFNQRWPVRRYEAQRGATRTACNAALARCVVRTVFEFRAENPATGARSVGTSELVLDVAFSGGRPQIVAESSRVLSRGLVGAAAGPRRGA